jgi:hypothetical protein
MDTVLVIVTLISLGLAASMGAVVLKLLRDERRRSDARVEALIEAASASPVAVPEPAIAAARPIAHAPAVRTAPAARAAAPAPHPAGRDRALDDFEIRPAAAAGVGEIFAEPVRSSPWGRRFVVIGSLAAVGLAAVAVLTPDRDARSAEPAAATTERATTVPAPLELVSLRHTQDGETLTVSGLVRNPRAGVALTRILVTAVALGSDGTLVASGRAPLDFTSLGPGDESPFVVTVPVRGAVARYRVGFRSEDGSVVAHVDRRAADVSRAGL